MAYRVGARPETRASSLALRAWPAIPPLAMIFPVLRHAAATGDLAGDVLGFDAVLTLVACLTVTPLMTVMKARAARLRWWYGVWTFTLGFAGLAVALAVGRADVEGAVAGSSATWTGLLLVMLLLPMTATSNAAAQKLLGPEWKRWHRMLIWTVWALIAVHLAALHDWLVLAAYAAATVPLLLLRSRRVRKSVKAWRAGRYSTGGWWTALAVLAALYLAGIVVLVTEQGLACARAVAA